jgi:hypothetical protein
MVIPVEPSLILAMGVCHGVLSFSPVDTIGEKLESGAICQVPYIVYFFS